MTRTIAVAAAVSLLLGCQGVAETGGPPRSTDVADMTSGGEDADSQPGDTGVGPPVDLGSTPSPDLAASDDGGGSAPDAAALDVGIDAGGGPTRSAGCTNGAGLADGEITFTLDGYDRRYMLRLPENYTGDRAWPLVFALHGNGGSVSYWDGTSGGRNIREVLKTEAVLVVAEAIDGKWRDYDADESTWPARIELELAYFEKVMGDVKGALCIDEDAVFSMGFSGGGSFSGVLGCRRTDIRGIAVGGSVIYFDEANCVGTPAAWITIGTEELVPGREAYRDFFRDRAGCEATSTATEPAPCVAYEGCGAETPVHYCQHPDGHIWPAFGSEASWSFFQSLIESP